MAKLTDLIVHFQKYLNEHGDMAVVFRDSKDHPHDILSCGMCEADDIGGNVVTVCWLTDKFVTDENTSANVGTQAQAEVEKVIS